MRSRLLKRISDRKTPLRNLSLSPPPHTHKMIKSHHSLQNPPKISFNILPDSIESISSENSTYKALVSLHEVAKSSLGPNGCSQTLKMGSGGFAKVLVTCNAHQFLSHVQVHDALASILLQTATNRSLLSDSVWEFLYLSTLILMKSLEWPMHWKQDLLYWFQQKLGLFFQEGYDERIRIDVVHDVDLMVALLCSVLSSSYLLSTLEEQDKIHICLQLVKAFFAALPDDLSASAKRNQGFIKKPIVKLVMQQNRWTPDQSMHIDGLLLKIPIPDQELDYLLKWKRKGMEVSQNDAETNSLLQRMAPQLSNVSIIIYKLPLQFETILNNFDHLDTFNKELNKESQKVRVQLDFEDENGDASQDQSARQEIHAMNLYTQLVQQYVKQGIAVVASQKTIHPYVKYQLVTNGILPLERLSILHVESLRQMAHAQILGEISTVIPTDCIGHLCSIQRVQLMGADRVHLHVQGHTFESWRKVVLPWMEQYCEDSSSTSTQERSDPSPEIEKFRTVILGVESPFIADELETLAEKCLEILHQILYHPFIVMGGSNIELRLFSYLEECIKQEIHRQEQAFDTSTLFGGIELTNRERESPSVTLQKLSRCAHEIASIFKEYSLCLLKDENKTEELLKNPSVTFDLLLEEYCETIFDFWISKKRSIEEAFQSASLIGGVSCVVEQATE